MNTKLLQAKAESLISGLHYGAVDNEDGDCDQCSYFHRFEEHHPYGMGTATEYLCECTVEEKGEQEDCPVVQEILAEAQRMVDARKGA